MWELWLKDTASPSRVWLSGGEGAQANWLVHGKVQMLEDCCEQWFPNEGNFVPNGQEVTSVDIFHCYNLSGSVTDI